MEALNLFICPNYQRPPSIRQPEPEKPPLPQSGIKGIRWYRKGSYWKVFACGQYKGKAKTINEAKKILRRSEK